MGFDRADDLICAGRRSGEGESLGGSGFDLVLNLYEFGQKFFFGLWQVGLSFDGDPGLHQHPFVKD